LRDVTTEQEAELNRKIKALEKELSSLQDIQGLLARWSTFAVTTIDLGTLQQFSYGHY
jgi:hypothetical protein